MMIRCLLVLVLGLLTSGAGFAASTADETFESLTVGTNVYAKVTVLTKTRADVFVKHSKGMANFKVKDLDPGTQARLGYQVEQPKPSKVDQVMQAAKVDQVQEQLESDPRYQQFADAIDRFDEQTTYAVVGAITFAYLLFCFLCRCICVKTGNPPSLYIWLPLLKQIPLFKAAGMSPWWILSNFVPFLPLVAYIIWCFKIVNSRGKHVLFAVMLLLPLTNVLAFLYLALSGDGSRKAEGSRGVISLGGTPRQAAA